MTDQIEILREKIRRMEKTLARTGDEYLTKVCRAEISALRRELKNAET